MPRGWLVDHPKRFRLGRRQYSGGDKSLVSHLAQNQIPTLQRPLRFTARIIGGGPFEHPHQQGGLVEIKMACRLSEEKHAGQPETVNRSVAVLPQIDFVEVSFEDLLFVVMKLQQQGHHHFGELAS